VKELSAERRALLAAVLSLLVIVAWAYLYKPKPQPAPPMPTPQVSTSPPPVVSAAAPSTPATSLVKAATQEKTFVVENGLYRVEFSNRGAVVRSWQLKKYRDDAKPPRTLDLVHRDAAQQTGGWPFSLLLDDPQLEKAANSALFVATPESASLAAPAQIEFEWSDGHLAVWKRLKFDRDSYIVGLESSVTLDGTPLAHGVAWRGGFGDATVYQPAERMQVFTSTGGKLLSLPHKKLALPREPAQRRQAGTADYTGIEDPYFAAAFLPRTGTPGGLAVWQWKLEREVVQEGKPAKEPVAEMAAGLPAAGPTSLRVYVGPKDLDELKRVTPPLSDLIQFGYLEFIAAPLFYLLEWIHRYVPNYGWAIILMTVLINMVLFPLKMKSWRSMQKMQKVAPEVKAIQERYKKYSMRDPRKAEMNKEVMAVYQREGINPMGGCLPMVLQMPIWFGLYRMLGVTIELRHAPWLGWIRDLSARDQYYILPVLMAVTMYAMQKMTPTTAVTDPAQQRMMTMMPLMMGGMFVVFPVSSGLVLYILSSNLVGMAQQWYLNRTAPADAKPTRGKKR
jgi:YidC/Oxa1 family membrane protein insertase